MNDPIDFSMLKWVRKELGEVLSRARESIEEYVEHPKDTTHLDVLTGHLRQVQGTLKIVEVSGAQMIIDEVQQLVDAIQADTVPDWNKACDIAMGALIQVPDYLDCLIDGLRDMPVVLLPVLNDMRVMRGKSPLSEGAMFSPDFSVALPAEVIDGDASFSQHPKELRRQFQVHLLSLLREQDVEEALDGLLQVLESSMNIALSSEVSRLWWIASAVVMAIKEGSLSSNAAIKVLMGKMDLSLKRLAEGGEEALPDEEIEALSRNLLFHVARANSEVPRIREIQALFQLEALLPREDELEIFQRTLSGNNNELFVAVGSVVKEELVSLKDTLDILMRDETGHALNLDEVSQGMETLSGTLGMLGLTEDQKNVKDNISLLERYIEDDRKPDASDYIRIAECLLQAESSVYRLSGEPGINADNTASPGTGSDELEFDQVRSVVLTEALTDLNAATDILTSCFSENTSENLPEVARYLGQVKGGLLLLGDARTSSVVGRLEKYFQQGMQQTGWLPPENQHEVLADALCGVEVYLNDLRVSNVSLETSIALAEQRVAELGLSATGVEKSAEKTVEREDIEATDPEQIFPLVEKTLDVPETSDLLSGNIPDLTEAASGDDALLQRYEDEMRDYPVLGDDTDEEILEIFVEEAEEEIASIETQLAAWSVNPENTDALESMRRSYHTLKGSGRLVGAMRMGEFGWSVEDLLNKVLSGKVNSSATLKSFLQDANSTLQTLLAQIKTGSKLEHSVTDKITQAINLATGITEADVESVDVVVDSEPEADESFATYEDQGFDPVLLEIFREETRSHLSIIDAFVDAEEGHVSEALQRAVHTLRGSATMAEVEEVSQLAGRMEHYLTRLAAKDEPLAGGDYDNLSRGREFIAGIVEQLPRNIQSPAGLEEYLLHLETVIEQLQLAPDIEPVKFELPVVDQSPTESTPFIPAVVQGIDDPYAHCDKELLPIFVDEGVELLARTDATLAVWSSAIDDNDVIERFLRELHTLKGSARMADVVSIAEIAHAMESLITTVYESGMQESPEAVACVRLAQNRLHEQFQKIDQKQALRNSDALLDKMQKTEAMLQIAAAENTKRTIPEAIDPEILNIFLEEADDILNLSENTLQNWKNSPEDLSIVVALQRELHTLKGGARMADISEIGDLSHAIETLLAQITRRQQTPTEEMFTVLERAHDRLTSMVSCVREHQPLPDAAELYEYLGALSRGEPINLTRMVTVSTDGSEQQADRRKALRVTHELVRVRADILDQLVNHAGEISIYRSRLEQQVGASRFNLGEMEQTVTRLREQLRKLDIETEAQMLFRYEKENDASDADFDPLEMDRYSHLQQLSRSLLESVADLTSIQGMLENITRESETLLLQQSRVSSDLQEGLLRTRMVPFIGLAPRLRRVVRQTAEELGKNVELHFSGAEGELDRTVIDRIIAPVEHMLRNAIAHGIERPDVRSGSGKTETGHLTIDFSRDSSDVVLKISDDGAGIDVEKVRQKAIERGIINENTILGDYETLQLILHSGLSTAEEVTQVSGRGVGMDVVSSEVKQLGGSFRIESERGKGTTFIIRLPFTVALNNALLVEIGEDSYAIPLSNIHGVVRVQKNDLINYYEDSDARLEYGGKSYTVHYLGELLGMKHRNPASMRNTESLLLVNSNDYSVALQVDNLVGSREIVVKSVGRQISSVHGVSGATILGDGRVVMILELAPLLRIGESLQAQPEDIIPQQIAPQTRTTVMVVDDSITVRKVTSRLLEKNNYHVVTAKDGIDAVSRLHDVVPDIFIMDIEMPRMDGFELASYVRSDSRLSRIPIVMITSRTGAKHRQRAVDVGVNEYLGKPFQEAELIAIIESYTSNEAHQN